jgi:hypothetical protein
MFINRDKAQQSIAKIRRSISKIKEPWEGKKKT